MTMYDPNDLENDQTAFYSERTEEQDTNTGVYVVLTFIATLITYFLA